MDDPVPGSCRSLLDLCLLISFFSGFFPFVVSHVRIQRSAQRVCSLHASQLDFSYGLHLLLLFDALSTAYKLLLTRIF